MMPVEKLDDIRVGDYYCSDHGIGIISSIEIELNRMRVNGYRPKDVNFVNGKDTKLRMAENVGEAFERLRIADNSQYPADIYFRSVRSYWDIEFLMLALRPFDKTLIRESYVGMDVVLKGMTFVLTFLSQQEAESFVRGVDDFKANPPLETENLLNGSRLGRSVPIMQPVMHRHRHPKPPTFGKHVFIWYGLIQLAPNNFHIQRASAESEREYVKEIIQKGPYFAIPLL